MIGTHVISRSPAFVRCHAPTKHKTNSRPFRQFSGAHVRWAPPSLALPTEPSTTTADLQLNTELARSAEDLSLYRSFVGPSLSATRPAAAAADSGGGWGGGRRAALPEPVRLYKWWVFDGFSMGFRGTGAVRNGFHDSWLTFRFIAIGKLRNSFLIVGLK